MSRSLRCLVAGLVALASSAAAQVDANLQNLLAGLAQGTPVTLMTPIGNGLVQVTSFTPAGAMSPVAAAAAVEGARQALAVLGVTHPTGQQLATALVGGTVDIPTGSAQIQGTLAQPPQAPPTTQTVFGASLPQVAAPAGQLPGAPSAEQLAAQQLAALGIANPTRQQIQSAIAGGTVTAPNGVSYTLPGIQVGSSAVGGTAAPSGIASPSGIGPTPAPPGSSPAAGSGAPIISPAPSVSPPNTGAPIVSPLIPRQ